MSEDRIVPYGVGAWSDDEARRKAFGEPEDPIAAAEQRGAALAVEQCRRLAEEMIAGQPLHNQFSDGYKAACHEFIRRLRESAP